jgi:predicted molibdopterin-dependent oxidoreductase YjgC
MSNGVQGLRLPRVSGRAVVAVTVDGESVQAYPGETVATLLLALGRLTFRHTERGHVPRGVFCGMGVCFDCLVTIDGQPNVRACLTPVQAGMVVETGGPAHA